MVGTLASLDGARLTETRGPSAEVVAFPSPLSSRRVPPLSWPHGPGPSRPASPAGGPVVADGSCGGSAGCWPAGPLSCCNCCNCSMGPERLAASEVALIALQI